MDSFTEDLLERTKLRQETLDKKIKNSGLKTPQKQTSANSSNFRKRPSPLREDNPTVESVQAKKQPVESCTKSPAKKRVSFKSNKNVVDGENRENNKEGFGLKGRLRKLAMLHSGEDVLESPPNKPQRLYPDLSSIKADEENLPTPVPLKRRDRLASLAQNYKSMEDETSQPPVTTGKTTSSTETTKEDSKSDTIKSTTFTQALEKFKTANTNQVGPSKNSLKRKACEPVKPTNLQNTASSASSAMINTIKTAKSIWDDGIANSLKAQGFVQSPSKSKLEYEFNKNSSSVKKLSPRKSASFRTPAPPPMPKAIGQDKLKEKKEEKKETTPKKNPISQNNSTFSPVRDIGRFDIKLKSTANAVDYVDEKRKPSPTKNKADPSILPLSARVALFEQATQAEAQAAAAARALSSPKKIQVKKTISTPIQSPQTKVTRMPSSVGKATETIHRKLQEKTEEWKSNEIISKMKSERRNDMNLLLTRWEQASAIMDGENDQIVERKSFSNSESNKYGHNSNEDSAESSELEELNTDESDRSIVSAEDEDFSDDYKENVYSKPSDQPIASSVKPESSDDEGDISELLDEAIENDSDSSESAIGNSSFMKIANKYVKSPIKSPPKPPRVYKPISPPASQPSPPKQTPVYYDLGTQSVDESLMHSVSFYRRQKQEISTPPVRTIVRREEIRSPPSPQKEDTVPLKEKIRNLQEAVSAQQSIISQASQALNLCRSSVEFHGSAEQVEGEKLLLIATHKRQAYLNEIQHLKTESALNKGKDVEAASGSVSIKNISLPLKRDYLSQSDNGQSGDFVHFFICLVKHGAQVIATQMLSTKDNVSNGMLVFPNLLNIRDLNFHFNILLEVYGLQTLRTQVSTGKTKTLSKKDKSKLNLTPLKKLSKSDTKSINIQSPGGPSAVHTSSFALIGFVNINLKSLNRKTWMLEKVPYISPLDGNLLMIVQCSSDYNIEERGFLTMFDDVSGFGAWHRRWCCLSGSQLSYWKYPNDEKNRKVPIGSINLRACITANVGLLSRDQCARHHTFMLITIRAPDDDEEETLVCQRFGQYATTKHLLSADTKEERIVWCDGLNKALRNIRMWDPEAVTPFDLNPSESEC